MIKCDYQDCEKVGSRKGLCGTHYQRLRRNGTTELRRAPNGAGYVNASGYRTIRVQGRYIFEHRHVMQQVLGRNLLPGEWVHHKNGVKDDNSPSNLELWVTYQPSGQRPEDLLAWADEIIRRYRPASTRH